MALKVKKLPQRCLILIEILLTIVRRAPEVRNNKKSIIIPLLERIGDLELLSIYRLPSATDQQFFCLAKAPRRKEIRFLFYPKC